MTALPYRNLADMMRTVRVARYTSRKKQPRPLISATITPTKSAPASHLRSALKKRFDKERGNNDAHEQCRGCTEIDCPAGQMAAPFEIRELHPRSRARRFIHLFPILLVVARAVDSARETISHNTYQRGYAGQQKDRSDRELNRVGNEGHAVSRRHRVAPSDVAVARRCLA